MKLLTIAIPSYNRNEHIKATFSLLLPQKTLSRSFLRTFA
jgi:hypothetical protein